MSDNSTHYSIIIPHYNIPDLLERCLKSIPVCNDVQTIVVDDNSPESCQSAVHDLEERYPHVTFVYEKKNGGAGRARNVGMEHAVGDYLIFADADDFFTDSFSEILDRYAKESRYDVIYFRNISVSSEDTLIENNRTVFIDEIFDRYVKSGDESEIRCKIFNPWAKFFRKEFISSNNILFDEFPCSNDIFFVVSAGCKATLIKVDNTSIYAYTERMSSITGVFSNKNNALPIRAEACFKAQRVMKEQGYVFSFMPMSEFMSAMFHSDKQLYLTYLRKAKEAYPSRRAVIRQISGWENGILAKLWVYLYSFFALIIAK